MKYSKVISVLLIASLLFQGCTATVYLKPPADSSEASVSAREVEGEILKNEGGILFVDDGDQVLEIPTETVEDIDHPGVVAAVTGGVLIVSGIGFFVWASQMEVPGMLLVGMAGALLTIVGIPLGLRGVITYSRSKSAAKPLAVNETSLEGLSAAPTPFTVPSARGLSVTITF